jgi:hypothetical protein
LLPTAISARDRLNIGKLSPDGDRIGVSTRFSLENSGSSEESMLYRPSSPRFWILLAVDVAIFPVTATIQLARLIRRTWSGRSGSVNPQPGLETDGKLR